MANIKNILLNFLASESSICRLCLKELDENSLNLKDEVFLDHEGGKITVLNILKEVLLENIDLDSALLYTLCENCMKSAISAYNFIRMCRDSNEYLLNLVENVSNCLVDSVTTVHMAKSVYLSVANNKHCEVFFDYKRPVSTPKQALKRYRSIRGAKKITHTGDVIFQYVTRKRNKKALRSSVTKDLCSDKKSRMCNLCLKTFHSNYNMKAHYIRVHAPKVFPCSECPRRFGSSYLLKLHLSESHIQVICAECGKTYNNVHSLKLHEMSTHRAKMLCPSCGKHYKNRASYRRHVHLKACSKVMGDDKQLQYLDKYTCDVCQKSFTQKGALRVHITFEHGNAKAYICAWCGKRFPARSRLQAHVVKHTRERNFTCDICGGKFVTKESLLYHTRIHTGEKPYPCSYCDQRFLSASRRMEHLRRKHLGSTLICEVCNSRFKTPCCLKKHMKRHTNPNSRLFNDGVAPNYAEV